jgi:ubiquinone/menaquinone biosynthesis C-methylase UbiE
LPILLGCEKLAWREKAVQSIHTFFGVKTDRKMSDTAFRIMSLIMKTLDSVFGQRRQVERRVGSFGLGEGFTVVDYCCGPGRYVPPTSRLIGDAGKLYAVDVHELALEAVRKRVEEHGLRNVETMLAGAYSCDVAEGSAHAIYLLDAIHMIRDTKRFFVELHRIARPDGFLIVDDGHQSREETKAQIADSGLWSIFEESKDHLRCVPIPQ